MLPKIITSKFYAPITKVVDNSMISLLETLSQLHLLQNGWTPSVWNFFNGIVRNTHEVKLKDFQFKTNNHILVTKPFLYKLIKQIMTNVPYVTKILKQLVICFTIVIRLTNSGQLVTNKWKYKSWCDNQNSFIFKNKENKLLNHLLILARYFIYKKMHNELHYIRKLFQLS